MNASIEYHPELDRNDYLTICSRRVRRGYYVGSRKLIFLTTKTEYFGGRTIPSGSVCEFWEAQNFGWVKWVKQNGDKHIANF